MVCVCSFLECVILRTHSLDQHEERQDMNATAIAILLFTLNNLVPAEDRDSKGIEELGVARMNQFCDKYKESEACRDSEKS